LRHPHSSEYPRGSGKREGENRLQVEKLEATRVIWAVLGAFTSFRMTLSKKTRERTKTKLSKQEQEQLQSSDG
jgi:hypothetical protein